MHTTNSHCTYCIPFAQLKMDFSTFLGRTSTFKRIRIHPSPLQLLWAWGWLKMREPWKSTAHCYNPNQKPMTFLLSAPLPHLILSHIHESGAYLEGFQSTVSPVHYHLFHHQASMLTGRGPARSRAEKLDQEKRHGVSSRRCAPFKQHWQN